ncbi:hypothetical protein [Salipiger mucosus]|uniref:Putative molybdopterin biosynthesis related protein methylmutase domain protein n=1 Tax=Salipiger mucosus DSM 16094 TaxID=1123237 RepID=S9RRH2_9RHOB|nr:hypothetical protein [Salipiger mucosus]EPX76559.1 putative molybdopterin biosynthesis related protein methylmutase domain protein [Salipiger mucosus DSM 16094]
MSDFDGIVMVDWSGGNDTGPRPRKDAIWIGESGPAGDAPPLYARNRVLAEEMLVARIEAALELGERLMIGFDFPFGYPRGFARALTGTADPFAVWRWIAERLEDSPRRNTRFHLGAAINRRFPGIGPFWFNGLQEDIPDLPRRDIREGHGMSERRACEDRARGSFSCWQLGGAGAVGGQVLTGLPVLDRLRSRFPGRVAAWPFEPLEAPVALVEIWPSLLKAPVAQAAARGGIKDAHQVRLTARALARLTPERRAAMLAVEAPEEGWILGLGHEPELCAALD